MDPGAPSTWSLHTRDRLPIDVLRALPGLVRGLGAAWRAGADWGAAGAGAAGVEAAAGEEAGEVEGEEEGEVGSEGLGEEADGEEGEGEGEEGAGAGVGSYQLRPQLLLGGGGGGGGAAGAALAALGDRLDGLYGGGGGTAGGVCRTSTGLVVVASLLENVPNMAGLCRWGEGALGGRTQGEGGHVLVGRWVFL